MTTNDAAERLLAETAERTVLGAYLTTTLDDAETALILLDTELTEARAKGRAEGAAAERRATVERIRAALEALPQQTQHADPFFPETYDYQTIGRDAVLAILDAEAGR